MSFGGDDVAEFDTDCDLDQRQYAVTVDTPLITGYKKMKTKRNEDKKNGNK